MVANYSGGATFAILRSPCPMAAQARRPTLIEAVPRHPSGHGRRQSATDLGNSPGNADHAGSRAHMIGNDPTGQFVVGDDAGRDEIHVWKLDIATGKLAEISKTTALPGSAPRHFVFSADGKLLYQLFEQDSRLGVYNFNNGKLVPRGKTVSLLPDGYGSSATGSGIADRQGRQAHLCRQMRTLKFHRRLRGSGGWQRQAHRQRRHQKPSSRRSLKRWIHPASSSIR